jgi:hypothetical protein
MKYYKVQSNRKKITSLIVSFRRNLSNGEKLISPRPEAGKTTLYYYAIVCVNDGGFNEASVLAIKNKKELNCTDFESEKSAIKFFWCVP